MLAKKHRINKKTIKDVLKKGKGYFSEHLSAKILFTPEKGKKFAFVISSKDVKGAVQRNTLKRRARHIIKENLPNIKEGTQAVFFLKKGVDKLTFAEMKKEINDIFNF
jgi:ribonuclease P protein component